MLDLKLGWSSWYDQNNLHHTYQKRVFGAWSKFAFRKHARVQSCRQTSSKWWKQLQYLFYIHYGIPSDKVFSIPCNNWKLIYMISILLLLIGVASVPPPPPRGGWGCGGGGVYLKWGVDLKVNWNLGKFCLYFRKCCIWREISLNVVWNGIQVQNCYEHPR